MPQLSAFGRDTRVNLLLGSGHFLSHFYQLFLPPLFIAWQQTFDVSFAKLGLVMAVMSATAAVTQTPMGFLVDRYGARPFLISGTLLMTLSMAAMGFTTAYWQIVILALLSGVGNSVFHPADYAILSGSIDPAWLGRSFAFHTFTGNIGFAAAPPGNRGADVAFRLARCPDLCRSSRSASGGDDRVAKPHPDRSSAPPVEPRGGRRGRAFVKPLGADVLHVLYGLIDGRRRHSILADHHPAPSARYHACSRLLGADRVLGRPDRRRAARRLGGRPHHPSPYRLSWF